MEENLRVWTKLALTCITLSRAGNQRARAVDTPEDIHFVIPGDDKDIPDRLTSSSAADIAWATVFPAPQSQSPPPVVEGSSPGPLTKTSKRVRFTAHSLLARAEPSAKYRAAGNGLPRQAVFGHEGSFL
ncbi:hypothetical protein CYMTET_42295 [Cymbomonas tetramitiformis]|uniref:Uncharacterized protein n=1 Tax=Cymbomonas tetramitiformis TaxID=36881 RepID=A0AAE0C5H7_9CHLO|nr:hypothetical protein CYMTET_42295 [Cymbomonas tetramitiformis]